MTRLVRPSATQSTAALWAKSLLNAVLFFAVFMVALPWLAHGVAPRALPLPETPRVVAAALLFVFGVGVWLFCLDVFSRRGRGTPFPLDAPSRLVTSGPFAVIRNPIMAAEVAVIWAEALWFASVGLFAYALLITVGAHLMVVFIEEPELRQRFGAEFDEYSRRVPRWWPGVRRRS